MQARCSASRMKHTKCSLITEKGARRLGSTGKKRWEMRRHAGLGRGSLRGGTLEGDARGHMGIDQADTGKGWWEGGDEGEGRLLKF